MSWALNFHFQIGGAPRNNPNPAAQSLDDVQFLKAIHAAFHGKDDELNYVDFTVQYQGKDIIRKTRIRRGGDAQESGFVSIRRT